MNKGKWTAIILFTAMMLVVAAFLVWIQAEERVGAPLTVIVSSDGHEEVIRPWYADDGLMYVFLPGYAELEKCTIRLETESAVCIDGSFIMEGMSCGQFAEDQPYELTYTEWGRQRTQSIVFMSSSSIAAMYVNTASGSMKYIHAEKGNSETADIRLYRADGALDYSGRLSDIHGRGNNTWEAYEKKPYSLELQEETDLLGMGKAGNWILLANASDPSHMRNRIVYDFANEIGMAFTPDCEWVELYLNGEYAGLYLLSERNEVHPERVDIGENDSLVSIEPAERLEKQGYSRLITDSGQALRVHYPRQAAYEQLEWLDGYWQNIETAILSGEAIGDLIDVESWLEKYLIEEVFGNYDACLISQYFYSNAASGVRKVYAGPIWDYDQTLGNRSVWQLFRPQSIFGNRLEVKEGHETPWMYCVLKNPEIYGKMTALYEKEWIPLLEKLMDHRLPEYAERIRDAQAADEIRWGSSISFDDEYEYLFDYLKKRIEFLSSIWLNGNEYYWVRMDAGTGTNYANCAVLPGQCLSDLPVLEDTENLTFLGWYRTDTWEKFDAEQPVHEDMEIVARWQDKPNRTVGQIVKLVPLGVIAVMFLVILAQDIRRMKQGG